MDTGKFFDFDTALPPDDPDQFQEEEGDEINALNEETFGSAAVELDWEQSHEQFASFNRAQKNGGRTEEAHPKLNADILPPSEIQKLERDLSDLYAKRMHEASVLESNILSDCMQTSMPGKSIWSFDVPKKEQRLISPNQTGIFRSSTLPDRNDFARTFPPPPRNPVPFYHQKVKTVAELESEMKANQLLRQLGPNNNMQLPPSRNFDGNFVNRQASNIFRQYMPMNTANMRNGMMGNPINFADQLKHGQRPPPNHYMMTQRPPMQGLAQPTHQWPPSMVGRNIYNQHRFAHVRPEIHNFPNNVSHFARPHFGGNAISTDRRYFDNTHYQQQQNFREKPKDDLDIEWDEWRRIKMNDPYAGLLNPKEKAWLRNIESKQHACENPYEDDYYYVMLNLKKQKRKDQEIVRVNGMQLLEKTRESKDYVPPTMPNSLGKLQVVSINAPRKIIDLPVTNTESSSTATPNQKELKKKRHILMYIEKLCNIQIELDDLERKVRGLPDCPTRDSYRSKFAQLIAKLWHAVITTEGTLTQILTIGKGRYLMSHLLEWLDETQLSIFFGTIFENVVAIPTDEETHLVTFWVQLDRFIANASQKNLLQLADKLDHQLCYKLEQDAAILSCKEFGLSVVLAMVIRGEVLWSVMEESREWPTFLTKAVYTLANFLSPPAITLSVLPSVFIAASVGHIRTQIGRCTSADAECVEKALAATALIVAAIRDKNRFSTPV